MSLTSSCPQCQKQVTVPDGAAGDAIVRCPLCDAQYPLSEAMALAPPMLIVVTPAAVPAGAAAVESGLGVAVEAAPMPGEAALAAPIAPLDPWQMVEEEEAADGNGEPIPFAEEEAAELEGGEKIDFAAITGRAPPAEGAEGAIPAPPLKKRRKKREITPLGMVARIVGMGVAAVLGLAGAFLLGSYFKADVDKLHLFHRGPNGQQGVAAAWASLWAKQGSSAEQEPVAERPATVSPAVPQNPAGEKPAAKMGPDSKTALEHLPDIAEKTEPEAEPKDPLGFSGPKIDPFAPPDGAFKPVAVGPAKTEPAAKVEPKPTPEPAPELPAKMETTPEPAPDLPAKMETKPEPAPESPAKPESVATVPEAQPKASPKPESPAAEPVGPREAPSYSPADLAEAVKAVNAVYGEPWDKISDEAYEKLRRLAEVLTFGKGSRGDDTGHQYDSAPAGTLLFKVADSPITREQVTKAALKVLEDPGKPGGGIILAGTVARVAEKNGLCGAALKTDAAPGPVMLLQTARNFAVKEDDRLVVAGSIVREPAKNIAGYTGSQPYVIWVGIYRKLP